MLKKLFLRHYCFAMVVLLCVSCGPAAKLRRAQRLIDKAIAEGASLKKDTTWTQLQVTVPPIHFSTKLADPDWGDTVYYKDPKSEAAVKIKRIQTPGKKDTVYIEVQVPPKVVEVPCPTVIDQHIKAGYTLWDLIILAIICLLAGTFLGPVVMDAFSRKEDK